MSFHPSQRTHQLRPNSKPLDIKRESNQRLPSNFTSTQPARQPLDMSLRNRNLSLNDLAQSRSQHQRRQSTNKESVREDSLESTMRETQKLKKKIGQLEYQKLELLKSNVDYEQNMNLWQQKAKRLKEEINQYQRNERQSMSVHQQNQRLKVQVSYLQNQNQKLKKIVFQLEEENKISLRKMNELKSSSYRSASQNRTNEMQITFLRLQEDYQDLRLKYQKENEKNKKMEEYVEKLQNQLEYLSKEIPEKINIIQKQKASQNSVSQHKIQQQLNKTNSQMINMKKVLIELQQKCNSRQKENILLKLEIQNIIQQKERTKLELHRSREQIQKGYQLYEKQRSKIYEFQLRQRQQESEKTKTMLTIQAFIQQKEDLKQRLQNKNQEISELRLENQRLIKIQLVNKNEVKQQKSNLKQSVNIYKQQNEQLKKTNQDAYKQIRQIQIYYSNQINKLKQQLSEQRKYINKQSQLQKEERSRINTIMQQKNIIFDDNSHLLSCLKEKDDEIKDINTKYMNQIEKLVFEVTEARRQLQQSKRELSDKRDISYIANTLKISLQQAAFDRAAIQRQLAEKEQELIEANGKISGLSRRLIQSQKLLEEQIKEIQTWKAYRLSVEDDARRQSRRFKKRVQELEQALNQQQNVGLYSELEAFQRTCQQLKRQMLDQETQSKKLLEDEKKKLNNALDEMEGQMRKILKQCDQKLSYKQTELSELKVQNGLYLQQIRELLQSQKLLKKSAEGTNIELQAQMDRLKKQLNQSKMDWSKIQSQLKKAQSELSIIRVSSQTQKQIKARSDKDFEQKIHEIQKLKLQVSQLTEELRKNKANKKQLELLESSLRSKEMQERQNAQRYKYLQNMLQTYQQQLRALKILREKQFAEKRSLQETKSVIQRDKRYAEQSKVGLQKRVHQLEVMISEKQNQIVREYQDKLRDLQRLLREWKQKYESANIENRSKQFKLSELYLKEQNLLVSLKQKDLKLKEQTQLIQKNNKLQLQIQDLKKKLLLSEQSLSQANSSIKQLQNYRKKCDSFEQNNSSDTKMIADQKQLIRQLSKDQSQKMQQIQILLSKINILENQRKIERENAYYQLQKGGKKRKQIYQNICKIKLSQSSANGLYFDGDQLKFLSIIYQYLNVLNKNLILAFEEITQKDKLLRQLTEDKQNLSSKYNKYKAIVLTQKNKKQVQNAELKNSYRYNLEILSHCQDIIKGRSQMKKGSK